MINILKQKIFNFVNKFFKKDDPFSICAYDKRTLPPLYFTVDYTVKSNLYLKGEEYEPYIYNYDRMIKLMNSGILSKNNTFEKILIHDSPRIEMILDINENTISIYNTQIREIESVIHLDKTKAKDIIKLLNCYIKNKN